MVIYDFVIRGFICSFEMNYLSRPLLSYINTSASAWIRLLLCKGFLLLFFAGSGKFYKLSKFSAD